MASAAFSINGTPVAGGVTVSVAGGAAISLAILSTTGARLIEWSITGSSDPTITTPTVTPAGTPSGATASFTMPTPGSAGYSVIVKCRTNGGVDSEGIAQSEYTATGLVGVVNVNGYLPNAAGELFERQSTHGIVKDLNDQLAGIASDGGGSSSVFPVLEVTSTTPLLTKASHEGRYLHFNNASPITVSIDVDAGFTIGKALPFKQKGAGVVTFQDGSGITINTQPGYTLVMAGQHAIGFLIPIDDNEFDLAGTLEPA